MATREIIEIDESKCDGCGVCVPNCHEGALQIIDNKARLISDLFCDGLGACIEKCPQDAITIVERDAVPYSESETLKQNIIPKGTNTLKAHLTHLRDHGATEFLNEALDYLKQNNLPNPIEGLTEPKQAFCGCPGSKEEDFTNEKPIASEDGARVSHLLHWPIQLHLVSPQAPYYQSKDVLLAADCTAYSIPDFHKNFIKGKSLAIACPKLDSNQDVYMDKLVSMIDNSLINTLTVAIMEVPCCGGLIRLAKEAASKATRNIPVKEIIISIKGDILSETWV